MFFEAGGDIPIDRFIAPRVEVELAFILGRPLQGPDVTLADVLAATDYVTPAVEIIDARIEQFDRETKAPRKVFDTIADFAANAGIVTGGRPVRARRGRPALGRRDALQERRHRGDRASPRPCSTTRATASSGSPTRSPRTTSGSTPATSSSAARSRGRRRRVRGDVFHVDYGPLGAIDFRFA